jgi:hypothetical protein
VPFLLLLMRWIGAKEGKTKGQEEWDKEKKSEFILFPHTIHTTHPWSHNRPALLDGLSSHFGKQTQKNSLLCG